LRGCKRRSANIRRGIAEPASEEQLAELNRGYDQSLANYNDLLKKRDDSQMATSMEQMQAGERFSVLDPPSLPSKPDFPKRLNFCAMGMRRAWRWERWWCWFEMADDRFTGSRRSRTCCRSPSSAEIPEVINPLDERRSAGGRSGMGNRGAGVGGHPRRLRDQLICTVKNEPQCIKPFSSSRAILSI
jgi:hypothetical protein